MSPALSRATCTLEIPIRGAISTATADFLKRGFEKAKHEECDSVLLTINTPGGNLQTTRGIVESIMRSEIPVLCVVSPKGGHAGSAGALILLSCHVSGALTSTNIGAATPILPDGASLGGDLRKKIVEDTKAWALSLAKERGRSQEFAEKIIVDAKAYDAESALKVKAVEIVAPTVTDFLEQARGREVSIGNSNEPTSAIATKTKVVVGPLISLSPDLRESFLGLISDPEISYLLFMAALALIYFEITHPGAIAPGVVGALFLIASLIAFEKLQVVWGAVGLILLGIVFLIAEAFVPSFGALGVGGIIALGAGSILLYDPANGGLALSPWLSLGVPVFLGALLLTLAFIVFRSRSLRTGESLAEAGIIGEQVEVDRVQDGHAFVTVRGEIWRVEVDGVSVSRENTLRVGDALIVDAIEGMKLKVKRPSETASNKK